MAKRVKRKKPVKGKGVFPTSKDVEEHVLKVQRKNKRLVTAAVVERSVEGRPIYAVGITDPRVKAKEKEHVLVVGGQHGNEESGRMVALKLIDWLVTKAGRETVQKQLVVVMPNVNPDGADYDIHGNVDGVHPNLDHNVASGPKTPEGRSVEAVARELRPEVFVDLHACGGTGCGVDMTLYPWTRVYTEDGRILHMIAEEMCAAGEKAGIPQTTFPMTWPGWGSPEPDREDPSSTLWHYLNFKSIVILTENTEHNEHSYPAALRAKTGLAKLKMLLAWGNRRHPKLPVAGYPCMLACSMFDRGVVAIGANAAERRESRLGIWRNAGAFRRIGLASPQEADRKLLRIEYVGERLKTGAGFQTCAAGKLRAVSVKFDGRKLTNSLTRGYHQWTAGPATFVMAAVPDLKPGEHTVEIELR